MSSWQLAWRPPPSVCECERVKKLSGQQTLQSIYHTHNTVVKNTTRFIYLSFTLNLHYQFYHQYMTNQTSSCQTETFLSLAGSDLCQCHVIICWPVLSEAAIYTYRHIYSCYIQTLPVNSMCETLYLRAKLSSDPLQQHTVCFNPV